MKLPTNNSRKLKALRLTMGESEGGYVLVLQMSKGDTWMMPYIQYLEDRAVPKEPRKAKKLKKISCRFTVIDLICNRLCSG